MQRRGHSLHGRYGAMGTQRHMGSCVDRDAGRNRHVDTGAHMCMWGCALRHMCTCGPPATRHLQHCSHRHATHVSMCVHMLRWRHTLPAEIPTRTEHTRAPCTLTCAHPSLAQSPPAPLPPAPRVCLHPGREGGVRGDDHGARHAHRAALLPPGLVPCCCLRHRAAATPGHQHLRLPHEPACQVRHLGHPAPWSPSPRGPFFPAPPPQLPHLLVLSGHPWCSACPRVLLPGAMQSHCPVTPASCVQAPCSHGAVLSRHTIL